MNDTSNASGSADSEEKGRFFEPLVLAVVAGATVGEAADQVGCSQSLAYKTSCSADFKERVKQLRVEIASAHVGRINQVCRVAIDALEELLGSENKPMVRLQAAKTVLSSVMPLSDGLETRQILEELEERLDARESQETQEEGA